MNHAETKRPADEGPGRGRAPIARPLVRASLAILFLLSSLPLGFFWSVILVVLLLVGLPLTIVWIGLPVLALAIAVCVVGAGVERRRLSALLGVRLPSPYRYPPRGSILERVRGRATDPALWRGLLYLLLLLPIGVVELAAVLVLGISAVLVSFPLWIWTLPDGQGVYFGSFRADSAAESPVVTLIGLVILAAVATFVPQVTRAHAALARLLLGPRDRDGLEERVEVLTESRSKVVEAAIVERRRIERDLHDGAQQRLVSLAMALGMARQKLEKGTNGRAANDPEAAQTTELQAAELVREAHEEAKRALAEIRDLIRGIHPAVLNDRGLDAAISALAGRSPVPTSVDVDLDERPPDAAEITTYFVIAEALTNVAKHANATRTSVLVRRDREKKRGRVGTDVLVAEVEDDGRGGADPAGTGLSGLATRVAALDGRLTVVSPIGGPTRVRVELPWGDPRVETWGGRDGR